jgi:cytochrome c oxidase subunit III
MSGHAHDEGHGGHHPRGLHHHFDTQLQQFESDKFGMWLFLATEILLFSGLFCAYAVYRNNHPEVFVYAHQYLSKIWGGTNTVILLVSSWTMAMAVRAAQLSQRKALVGFLFATLLCACGFMCVKAVEYSHKFHDGLLWGARYKVDHGHEGAASAADAHAAPESVAAGHGAAEGAHAAAGEVTPAAAAPVTSVTLSSGLVVESSKIGLAALPPAGLASSAGEIVAGHAIVEQPKNVQTFFAIYFAMTGLHGIHVLIGMIVIIIMMVKSSKGAYDAEYFTPIELTGLYWHLVDLIWIFLFPLLYLVG